MEARLRWKQHVRLLGVITAAATLALISAGCGHSRSSTPHLSALPSAQLEGQWLGPSATRHASVPRALDNALARAARAGGVQIVNVSDYRMQSVSPAITLAVSDPASFLKHRLDPVVVATVPYTSAYIRIVDTSGARVARVVQDRIGRSALGAARLTGLQPDRGSGLVERSVLPSAVDTAAEAPARPSGVFRNPRPAKAYVALNRR